MNTTGTLFVTERDRARLEALLAKTHATEIAPLHSELAKAVTMRSEDIPETVVTMNTRVRFKDLRTGEEAEVDLVYPNEADIDAGKISVLAPIGSALLGLSEGDSIEWPVPSGRTRTLQIIAVLFQPEAEGRYDL